METKDGVFMPVIRYALIAVGSGFVQQGFITADQLNIAVGAIITLGTTAWLVYNKKLRGV